MAGHLNALIRIKTDLTEIFSSKNVRKEEAEHLKKLFENMLRKIF